MAEVVKISSYTDFIDYAFDLYEKNKEPGVIEFDKSLDFHIKIKGSSWDGKIDYRTAEYVLNFQKYFFTALRNSEAFKECSPEYLQSLSRNIIIKFTISEGCTDIATHLIGALKSAMENMTGKQKVLTIAIIAAATVGYFSTTTYFDYRAKVETKKLDEKTKIELINTIDDANKNAAITNKAVIGLINKTSPGDTLFLPVEPEKEITSKEAKAIYTQKRERSSITTNHIDDRYMVTHLSLEEPQEFTLMRGKSTFNASADMGVRDSILEKLKGKKEIALDLQIDAAYTKKGFKWAKIVAEGAKRDGWVDIADVIKKN